MAFLPSSRVMSVRTVPACQPLAGPTSAMISSGVSGFPRHRASMTWLSAAETLGGMIHLYVDRTYSRNMQSQRLSLTVFLSYRPAVQRKKSKQTPHQQAEVELTEFGLTLPETEVG